MSGGIPTLTLLLIRGLVANLQTADAMLSWRYWPNVGCYEFSFERTVFFELSNGAVSLPNSGSELATIVNSTIIPASDEEPQFQHLVSGSIVNSTTNSPQQCIEACNATDYGYVGLMNGNTCVCVNEQPTARIDDSRCNIACSGNSNFTCGGAWAMNVLQYPADHSSGLTYLGCFKNSFDDLDRILEGGSFNNFRNNTPDWCVEFCTNTGYNFAGIQYGSQCLCSNAGPLGTGEEEKCHYKCAGDSSVRLCGGLGYINIFSTLEHKPDGQCGDIYYKKWYEDKQHCEVA